MARSRPADSLLEAVLPLFILLLMDVLLFYVFEEENINHGNLLCGRLSLGNFSPRRIFFKKCENIGIRRVKTSDLDIFAYFQYKFSKAVKGSHLESLSSPVN